jgi:ABC-2 type transport system permease protein
MHSYWTLTRRELASYFLSVTGYVVIAASLFLLGRCFVNLIKQVQYDPTPLPITELFFVTLYFWVILLLTVPIITMRLFAHEKFSGTFETLMTAPVSDLEVVMAKFTAALVFYLVMWLPLAGCLLMVQRYTNNAGGLDFAVIASTFLGILLLGCLFVSLGCFASALTRSQATAASVSLVLGLSLFLLALLADRNPAQGNWQAEALASLALVDQMHDFARGVVDTRPVVLYLSLSFFFLFLTLRVVESRRWK